MEKDNNGIMTGGVGVGTTTGSNSITTAGTNNTILPPKVCHWILVNGTIPKQFTHREN